MSDAATWTPMTPQQALACLREDLPPGGKVYTIELLAPADGAAIIVPLARVKTGGKPTFTNLSWWTARIGVCPLVEDFSMQALSVRSDGFAAAELVAAMEAAIWLDPTIEVRLTRRQTWRLRRAKSRMYPSRMRSSIRSGGLFEHEEIR